MNLMRTFIGFLLFCCLSVLNVNGQEVYLQIKGFVETLEGNRISGAVAELYEGTTRLKSYSTNADGLFLFQLPYGKNYSIVVTKPGMIKKRIDFNANIPQESQKKLINEFSVTLTQSCEKANLSVFNEPVDIVEFDNALGNFSSNKAHFERMKSRIVDAYLDIERCIQNKFQETKTAADNAFAAGKYEEAIKLYEEALTVIPNDVSSKKQIAQSKKNIEQQQVNNQKYEQVMKDAQLYQSQNQLTAAKQRYAEALKLKPGDATAQQKLQEIDGQLAKQSAEQQKQQAVNTEYNDLVTKANTAMAAQNYPQARQLFEQAQKLKPNEAFPAQKIAEAQQAMQKQELAKQEQERKDKAFADAMAQGQAAMQKGDFAGAQQLFMQALALKPSDAQPRLSMAEAQKLEAQKKTEEQQLQRAELERKFNEAVQKADGLLAQKQFEQAISAYQEALLLKSTDKYANSQLNKAKNLMVEDQKSKQAQTEQAYNQAIAQGDAKKLSQDFESAIAAYQQALQLKPADATATARLNEAQKLLAAAQAKQKEATETRAKYNQLVQEADGLFQSQQYENSKSSYQQALALYSTEAYPKNQITKIDNILAKNSQEAEYNQLVSEADKKFNQQDLTTAKTLFTQIAQKFPDKAYPKQKINEINDLQTKLAQQDLQSRFDKLTADAEISFTQGSYDQSKELLRQAGLLIPQNPYPQKRINEINAFIASKAKSETEAKYNQLAAQAEQEVTKENYEQAKSLYGQAAAIMPENTYPQKRINEINSLIVAKSKSATEAKYNQLAAQAEQQITQKNYDQAKALYAQAALILPDNTYPKQRINEINAMIDNDARQKQQEKYNSLISKADALFDQKQYTEAKTIYLQTASEFPNNPYPNQRINEINQLISSQARQKLEQDYNSTIAEADRFFEQKNYESATASYRKAAAILPEKTYPQQKINEISSLLTEAQRIENEKQVQQIRYNEAVALGDKYFSDKNYVLARTEYNKALAIFTDKDYPRTQIDKINSLLDEQQRAESDRLEKEQRYASAIARADELFRAKNYTESRNFYAQALGAKPGDAHAVSQVKRIDDLEKQLASEQQKAALTEARYKDLISNADSRFGGNDYSGAKQLYLAALEVKPNETYPREQIRKADERIKLLASAKPVNTTPTQTTGSKIADISFKNESERAKYLADLKTKYPPGVTLEIYKEGNKTTKRYIVIRESNIHECREIYFTWGGTQYSIDGKPTNVFNFEQLVKPRSGESFTQVEK